METLREFTTITNAFSAEYGKVSGGIINAVSRGGTNELHGSAFYFHRNDNLDARNFFDRGKIEFRRNQFGGSLAGPIRKNSTFFMVGYEGLREGLGDTTITPVPTALARQGILPDGPVTIHPVSKMYLDLAPLPNGRDWGDGRADFITDETIPTGEDFVSGRVNQKIPDNDMFFVRYTLSDAGRDSTDSLQVSRTEARTRMQSATLEETKIFSATLLNTFRFVIRIVAAAHLG